MASFAAEPAPEALALSQIVGVLLIRSGEGAVNIWRRTTNRVRHHSDVIQRRINGRIETKLARFTFTAAERHHEHENYCRLGPTFQQHKLIPCGGRTDVQSTPQPASSMSPRALGLTIRR